MQRNQDSKIDIVLALVFMSVILAAFISLILFIVVMILGEIESNRDQHEFYDRLKNKEVCSMT